MNSKPRVLIVDRSEDSREVLGTALRRLGIETIEASRAKQGLALARQHRPEVIVLDLEAEDQIDAHLRGLFASPSPGQQAALVVIGSYRIDRHPGEAGTAAAEQFVAKPYQFGPLIRKIEKLVASA